MPKRYPYSLSIVCCLLQQPHGSVNIASVTILVHQGCTEV